MTSKQLFLLIFTFFIFAAILLPETRHYVYYHDDVVEFERVRHMSNNPAAAWALDSKDHRRTPVFTILLFACYQLFGLHAECYFLALLLMHFLSSLLTARLAIRLGGSPLCAFLAALLFLCSGAFYQTLISIPCLTRTLSLVLFLSAALSWLDYLENPRKSRLALVLLLQSLSLMSSTVAVTFPFLATGLAFISQPTVHRRRAPLGLLCIFLVGAVLGFWVMGGFFSSGRYHSWVAPISLSFLIEKLLSALYGLLVPWLIPPKNLLGLSVLNNPWVRLAPLAFFVVVYTLLLRKSRWRIFLSLPFHPLTAPAVFWIVINLMLHIFYPVGYHHITRNLYFGMVGFCLLAGLVSEKLYEVLKSYRRNAAVFFGTSTLVFILALNMAITLHFMHIYQFYGALHPKEAATEKVKALFHTPASSHSLR